MAIAGRVAIVPKGEWSQDVTYDKLDLVTRNGNTFIAYKSSVGVEPVDGDTWMLVMQGIDPQEIENIINGTTPVGDANKLGGKSASEYALQSAVDKIQTTSRANIATVGWYRIAEINDRDTVQKCTIKILRPYYNTQAEIHTLDYERAREDKEYAEIKSLGSKTKGQAFKKARVIMDSNKTYFEVYYDAPYANNNCSFTVIDGGYINTWKAITPTLTSETLDGVTVVTTYDIPANASPATSVDLANYLLADGGGTVTGGYVPLILKDYASTGVLLGFTGTSGDLGYLGFNAKNIPILIESDGATVRQLLHTGNKPTGTYTGNGSARTITTGGIGGAVLIKQKGSTNHIIVDTSGYFGVVSGSFVSGSGVSLDASCNISLASDSKFNISGTAYEYHVL